MVGMAVSLLAYDPAVQRAPLTRAQYDALVAQGAFAGQPVELLEGELVTMAPQGPPHSRGIDLLARRLDRLLLAEHGEAFAVRQEKPFAASDLSEPEPDIAVVDAADAAWGLPGHPSRAHLVVEVADSSARVDLAHKPRVYAASEVPLYWVVDLARQRTVVHRDPRPAPDAGYDTVTTHLFTVPLEVLGVTLRLSDVIS
jgi:Uma2 family endonuclease